jgi:hypothetical protein
VQLLLVASLRCCSKRLQELQQQLGLAVTLMVGSSRKSSSNGGQGNSNDLLDTCNRVYRKPGNWSGVRNRAGYG